MTPYTEGNVYLDNEHHIVVAKNVDDVEARKLCDERANESASSFLDSLPEELRNPKMDEEIREMLGADLLFESSSDERKMEMPILTLSSEGEIEANNIIFYVDNGNTEIVKFCGNGDIFVHGRLAENDKEVVQGMRDFLKAVPKS
jgi:hypothetical protein